jgi:signal transduction histidine kinase
MLSELPAVGGWLVGVVGMLAAVHGRRSLSIRMELVARACHELRGPLTAARLGLELEGRNSPAWGPRLRALNLELGRAALALDDLSAVRAGRSIGAAPGSLRSLAHEPVDVRELLSDSVHAWEPAAAAAGGALLLEWTGAAADVDGDRLRLAQATGNLIANAIEHGGGVVGVRGRAAPGAVRIEVIDSGPGLPAPVAELARRARHGRGDRGRGLAIAAAIARAHGGRLAAAPSERGARLVLELPRAGGEARDVAGRGPDSGA